MLKNPLVLAFIASLFFGIWPVPFKISLSYGSWPDTIVWVGVGVVAAGLSWKIFEGTSWNVSAAFIQTTFIAGLIFCVGLILSLLALTSRDGYLSLIAPIYNINTIWAMLAGLVWFKEYEKVSVAYAVVGAVLITLGGGFIGLAKK